uniref:G protein-coupled receptor n=1 Tax=Panagrolaimus sp. PS1159 TaxID=55785 RepID=A0AC35FNC1_9BILA
MGVITPLILAEPYFDYYRNILLENVPIFAELEKQYSNIYVLSLSPINDYLTALVIIALFLTFAYALIFITLNLIVIHQLRKIKKLVSNSTYGIHKMLHTAVMIQTINLLLFAVVPISMIAGGLICQKSYGNLIANIGFPISSLHLIADAPALLHFIKPYRMFVMSLIPFKKKKTVRISAPSEWFRGGVSFITIT